MLRNFQLHRLTIYSLCALGMIILVVLGGLMLTDNKGSANAMVVHTVKVEAAIVEVLERTRALESAQRGYLISRRPDFLKDFEAAHRDLDMALDALHALSIDNPDQIRNLDRLRSTIERRIGLLQNTIGLVHAGKAEEARSLAARGAGPDLMRQAAAQVDEMLLIERRLLAKRTDYARYLAFLLTAGLVLAMVAVLILAGLMVLDARRQTARVMEARDAAEHAVEAAQNALVAREAAESKLRQLQKMESIGHLTGGIAHDFNNMLAIIIGSLDLAERRIKDTPARLLKCIHDARSGADRAALLTSRLLAFSRQQPLSPQPVNANEMVASMGELLKRTLGEHIIIEICPAATLWTSFVDIGQLENAILNLAVNARDAMPKGGVLMIETTNLTLEEDYAARYSEVKTGDYVLISVSDTGIGMTQDVIERAFDPFFTTKDAGKGTGLGLSQVYGFIKQSGGHVSLYSEPGEGTVVKLYLPRYEVGASTSGIPSQMTIVGLPMARDTEVILVVEDEERVRAFSVEALLELGYLPLSAANAEEALAILDARNDISLLFTDVVMPGMNGRELADAAQLFQPDLRVLFTTGYTRNAVVHNGMLDPGVALLTKPFTVMQLARKVRAVLDAGAVPIESIKV